jgi:hypothetical protein
MHQNKIIAALFAVFTTAAIAASPSEAIMEQFIDASDGSTITLPEGRFEFTICAHS